MKSMTAATAAAGALLLGVLLGSPSQAAVPTPAGQMLAPAAASLGGAAHVTDVRWRHHRHWRHRGWRWRHHRRWAHPRWHRYWRHGRWYRRWW